MEYIQNSNIYKFRKGIGKKNDSKCIISGVDSTQCEYAHIIPETLCTNNNLLLYSWNSYNGLFLSSNIHKSFEIALGKKPNFTLKIIDEDNKYLYCMLKISKESMEKNLTENKYIDKIININKNSKPFLIFHNKIFNYSYNIMDDNIQINNSLKICYYDWITQFINKYNKKKSNKKNLIKKTTNFKYSNAMYSVKKILSKRFCCRTKKYIYKIKWNGKDKNGKYFKNTWEPEINLSKDLIKNYK